VLEDHFAFEHSVFEAFFSGGGVRRGLREMGC
jgi:hypothetical protein